jgi:hypothetical protein
MRYGRQILSTYLRNLSMPYRVSLDIPNKLIQVEYSGNFDTGDRHLALKEVLQHLETHLDFSIFIDLTQGNETSSDEEQLLFGEFIADSYRNYPKLRIAVLTGPRQVGNLIISESYIKGLKKICAFESRYDALSWLRYGI